MIERISDLQRKILESAQANGGWYHLQPGLAGEGARLEWEACQSFVAGDYAKWLAKGQPAGIVLTHKALRLDPPPHSGSTD